MEFEGLWVRPQPCWREGVGAIGVGGASASVGGSSASVGTGDDGDSAGVSGVIAGVGVIDVGASVGGASVGTGVDGASPGDGTIGVGASVGGSSPGVGTGDNRLEKEERQPEKEGARQKLGLCVADNSAYDVMFPNGIISP
ncbi:hypothetical protein ACLB2K_005174 [Fragaria x ananassa]